MLTCEVNCMLTLKKVSSYMLGIFMLNAYVTERVSFMLTITNQGKYVI